MMVLFTIARLSLQRDTTHTPVTTVPYCAVDQQDAKLFGFVARKQGSTTDNVSHLFAELDPAQPAPAILSFLSRMMKR
ncbi:unnamed protein product [Boreogadus saida]